MLFTSLPIYWAEADGIAERLQSREVHWARRALEADHALVPLDALEPASLAAGGALLMVQPRPLAPAENVALDSWVRAGGRVLLFADPALTAESAFPPGDPRRPQDLVLLSPILARWGLVLQFDEAQPRGERRAEIAGGTALPVNLAGRFASAAGASHPCRMSAGALVATCAVERGRVIAVADAALFEPATAANGLADRRRALAALLAALGGQDGRAGEPGISRESPPADRPEAGTRDKRLISDENKATTG